MQTPTSRFVAPQKLSPAKPRVARKLKTALDSSSASSPNSVSKTSAKVVDRRSPRGVATENKRPIKVSELETQIAKLQEELKASKEANKQLSALSAELEETQKQLRELSESEDPRIQELRKLSQDRDRAWQSELEAVKKQHSMEASALASAKHEIQKLKIQLDRVSHSEASQARHAESAHVEITSLRHELTETLVLVDKLKAQLNDSREHEPQSENGEYDLKMEIDNLRNEVIRLRAAERRYKDEYFQITLEIRSAYELVERTKLESYNREAEMEQKLKQSIDEVLGLRSKMIQRDDKKNSDREAELETELKKTESTLEDLNMRLKTLMEENEKMKTEIWEKQLEREKSERVIEELDLAQTTNYEMEGELRRLKVQCDQWRKAAEAATAMLCDGSDGRYVEKTGAALEYLTLGRRLSSPEDEDTDDESPKKRNGNMLRKLGDLLKKGQK